MTNPLFPHQAGFPPTWAGRPRGLVEVERILWQWWRTTHGQHYEEFWFDVPLDGQPPREETLPSMAAQLDPKWRRVWKQATSKRADVIGRKGRHYEVIELRGDLQPQTLGELQMYVTLARREHPQLSIGPGIIVSDTADDIIPRAINAAGITLFLRSPHPPRPPVPQPLGAR